MSAKDIEILLINISPSISRVYLSDIKKEFKIKTVLFFHFKKYFKITEIS